MNGSGTFSIDTAQVGQSGAKFQEYSREYSNLMTQLKNTIEDLGSCWKGEDYTKFTAVYTQNAETIEQMSKAFASFGEILSSTSSDVNRLSQDLQDSFR